MAIKHSTQNRVGATYGDRRQAELTRKTGLPSSQPAESNGLFKKLRDFFSVDPKVVGLAFAPNAGFLDGENVHPFQAITDTGRRKPTFSDEALVSYIDKILSPVGNQKKA